MEFFNPSRSRNSSPEPDFEIFKKKTSETVIVDIAVPGEVMFFRRK